MKRWQNEILDYISEKNIMKFENALKAMKTLHYPKKIYKYCHFDEKNYFVDNLKHNKIYLNSPSNFNDPYDSCISYFFNDVWKDITREHIENSYEISKVQKNNILKLLNKDISIFDIRKKYRNNETIIETIDFIIEDIQENIEEIVINKVQDILCKNIKLSCFSETNNNILMWSHYAKNHTGFCVEYDITNDKFNQFKKDLYPIFYFKKPFVRLESSLGIDNFSFFLITLLSKFKDWGYEKEWRYLKINAKNDFVLMRQKPSSVYLGTKISEENIEILSSICKKIKVPCHRMIKRAESYYLQASTFYS